VQKKNSRGRMMPVDKGWCMRLHEAGLPSLIVSLGNDDKLTWNVCCNESDGPSVSRAFGTHAPLQAGEVAG